MISQEQYWQRVWNEVQPKLHAWRNSAHNEGQQYSSRVSKLDAELLDEEILQTLQDPLSKALRLINSDLGLKVEPELALLTRAILYRYSLWNLGTTYGAKLQGLRYATESNAQHLVSPSGLPYKTLIAHSCLTVLLPYFHQRLRGFALSNAWPDAPSSDGRRQAWDVLSKLEALCSTSSLLAFVMFLWNGRYQTLADRLVSMNLVPAQGFSNRQISYEFMNRQMVWHAFTELLLLLLPLLRSRTLKGYYYRLAESARTIEKYLVSGARPQANYSKSIKKGKFFDLSLNQCAICADKASLSLASSPSPDISLVGTIPSGAPDNAIKEVLPPLYPLTTPSVTPCGHVYCHYCISEALLGAIEDGKNGWICLRCTENINSCTRAHAICLDGSTHESDGWASDEGGLTSFESDISFESETELFET